ncbi:AP2/ERF and B3 domain-containing transcription factor [Raphanus sativus]|nr:AP2/ERF and B3 domain-containing transcription factor [Raphanus sativus]
MGMYNQMTETSSSSNSLLPLKKRKRPSFDDTTTTDNALVAATKKVALSGSSKYKGIVEHRNGHWGAQIYIDHKRIWLGTFKSSVEAAMAYDSASLKLRSFDADSHRNFPLNAFTVYEPNFQKGYTTEAVLDMIKEGSYQDRFRDFLSLPFRNVASSINLVGSKQVRGGGGQGSNTWTELFRKGLTPSDVGKLNRLVIPKKQAVKYLPLIEEREEGEIVEDVVEVVFYDRGMRQWKFRYCYWTSSQSFVFTSGWKRFVKEKNLKERDVIVFYRCELEGQSKNFLMIDVHCYSGDDSVVIDEEVNESHVHYTSEGEVKTGNDNSSKLKEEETKSVENKAGFMLFGVKIQ